MTQDYTPMTLPIYRLYTSSGTGPATFKTYPYQTTLEHLNTEVQRAQSFSAVRGTKLVVVDWPGMPQELVTVLDEWGTGCTIEIEKIQIKPVVNEPEKLSSDKQSTLDIVRYALGKIVTEGEAEMCIREMLRYGIVFRRAETLE
jgi:hypothetical protein